MDDEIDVVTQRHAVDILKIVSADTAGDDEMLREVLDTYVQADHGELLSFITTSLSITSLLVEHLARLKKQTPEQIIDEMLLEVS